MCVCVYGHKYPEDLKIRHSLRTHTELLSLLGRRKSSSALMSVTLWTENWPLSLTSPITVKESGFPWEASNGSSAGPSLGPWDLQSRKSSRVETVAQIELSANKQSHLSLSFSFSLALSFCLCLSVSLSQLIRISKQSFSLNGGWWDKEQLDLALLL